jgi:hypothetical protein
LLTVGCSEPLRGTLELEYVFETSQLVTTFVPAEGMTHDPETTFVKFEAYGGKLRDGGSEVTTFCKNLPGGAALRTTVTNIENGASVDVTVWSDVPEKPKGDHPGPAPEPRPCQGLPVVFATWTSTIVVEALGEVSDPGPIETCGSASATFELENLGEGDLEIRAAHVAPSGAARLDMHAMPVTLTPNELLDVTVTLAGDADFAEVTFETNDPKRPTLQVSIRATPLEILATPSPLIFAPGQSEAYLDLSVSCGDLEDVDFAIGSIVTDPTGESAGAFGIGGCGAACTLPRPSRIVVEYANDDESVGDVAELEMSMPGAESAKVLLVGQDERCEPSDASYTVTSTATCVGRPIALDGRSPDAVGYSWMVLHPEETVFDDAGDGTATLTPKEPGQHVVTLEIINACGAESAPSVFPIDVDEVCPDE